MLQSPPTAPTATIAPLCARYVAMLEDAGIPTPLQQELTVAAVLADLCALAGEQPPDHVRASLGLQTGAVQELGKKTIEHS